MLEAEALLGVKLLSLSRNQHPFTLEVFCSPAIRCGQLLFGGLFKTIKLTEELLWV